MHFKGSEENFFLFTYSPKLTFCEEELRVPAELCKDKKTPCRSYLYQMKTVLQSFIYLNKITFCTLKSML